MKVLFAGPSLYATDWVAGRSHNGVDCRGPAAQGDIARAAVEGATVIGLIDGRYEDIAAVWHKEILYAIEQGALVFGAASMGALRAAECADFGMIGVGAVFERYRSGELTDDAAVAQLHAPVELDYLPLTEALVNVEATIQRFLKLRAIAETEALALDQAARVLFFKERTYSKILAQAGLDKGERGKHLHELIKRCRVDQKREDALMLANYLACIKAERQAAPAWKLNTTYTWNLTLARAQKLAFPDADKTEAA
jgi:hypothetical protein